MHPSDWLEKYFEKVAQSSTRGQEAVEYARAQKNKSGIETGEEKRRRILDAREEGFSEFSSLHARICFGKSTRVDFIRP